MILISTHHPANAKFHAYGGGNWITILEPDGSEFSIHLNTCSPEFLASLKLAVDQAIEHKTEAPHG